ncbi:MAG: prepilin-type N-terminal cleavage/methylation domain-containing protein [Phycisphaerales bacterium]|nr:prepilin-type N-terminal cleavage/methylation domain-containing protein [Phycisphaerales bacterium]
MRRGFTLVELVVALAVMSIVMAGLGSVFVLAARGAEASSDDSGAASTAGLNAMAADLRDAVRISAASARDVTFEVADRNGDSAREVIRYAWSGTAGDALVRTCNGASADATGPLDAFSLAYATSTRQRSTTAGTVTSAETLLASYTGSVSGMQSVTATNTVGQVFAPLLPSQATAWRLTRLRVNMTRGGGSGNVLGIQLRSVPSTGMGGSSVLESWSLATSSMSNSGRYETFTVTSTFNYLPSTILAISLSQASGLLSSTAVIPYQASGVADPDNQMLTALVGGLGGLTWSSYPESSLQFEVYGTYTTPATTTSTVTIYDSIDIRATLKPGGRGRAAAPFATTIRFPIGAEP